MKTRIEQVSSRARPRMTLSSNYSGHPLAAFPRVFGVSVVSSSLL